MTVLTEVGRDYIDDLQYGRALDPIDTIAVGTGTAPESQDDTALDNQIYESTVANSDVSFDKVPGTTGSTYASISVRGGYEVPAGAEITEVGVFVGPQNLLVYRDVQNPQIVESGYEVRLRLKLDSVRV